MNDLVRAETVSIQNKIYELRGQKVMLDFDIAEMYEVETKRINEAVRRNIERFPYRFMFRLTQEEWDNLMRSQIATAYNQRKRNTGVTPRTRHNNVSKRAAE
jgi:hypothetical protein